MSGEPLVVGWLGSTSTVKYLRLIEPVLRDIALRYPEVRFELMGGGEFAMEGVPWTLLPWSLQGEVDALQRWTIGLMPLPDETWAQGKSGGKARTYMAAGVVPVCTGIGYNLQLIEHGRTGMLCTTLDEWRLALDCVITDEAFRESLAVAARVSVRERFDPAATADRLRSILEAVAAGRRPPTQAARGC